MSEEFLKIARKEIQEDIDQIQKILKSCKNDKDVESNAVEIEKYFHKIKGLAPMMGQKSIGDIAKTLDQMLKYVITEGNLANTYKILVKSSETMNAVLNGSEKDIQSLKDQISKIFPTTQG